MPLKFKDVSGDELFFGDLDQNDIEVEMQDKDGHNHTYMYIGKEEVQQIIKHLQEQFNLNP